MSPTQSGRGDNIPLIVFGSFFGAIYLVLIVGLIVDIIRLRCSNKSDRPASATSQLEAGLIPPQGRNPPVVPATTGSRRLANFVPIGSFPPKRVRFTPKLASIPEENEAELLAEGEESEQSGPILTQLHPIGAGETRLRGFTLETDSFPISWKRFSSSTVVLSDSSTPNPDNISSPCD